jgi:hypothetical protein
LGDTFELLRAKQTEDQSEAFSFGSRAQHAHREDASIGGMSEVFKGRVNAVLFPTSHSADTTCGAEESSYER